MNFKSTIKLFVTTLLLSGLFSFNTLIVNAETLQSDKPLFVIISTNWCYACKLLHPITNELEALYSRQVNFLHLDASNEEAVNSSRFIAAQYGLAAYFDSNRNVFPKIGILCPDSTNPEKVIIGAAGKESYIDAIKTFILDPNKVCSIKATPAITVGVPSPSESEIPEIISGRPELPNLLDRPNEIATSGRPKELSFWIVGQPIPTYAYSQYLLLPKCSANSNIVCSNISLDIQDVKNASGPTFKPYNPNATRDEKGYHF